MKSKNKGLALLLILMMLISMNPAIAFSENYGPDDILNDFTSEVDETVNAVTSGSDDQSVGDVTDQSVGDVTDQTVTDDQSAGDDTGRTVIVVQSAGDVGDQTADAVQQVEESSDQTADAVQPAGDGSDQTGEAVLPAEGNNGQAGGGDAVVNNPAGADGSSEDTAKTEPSDAYDSLGKAIGSEFDAAKEFFPQPELWNEIGAIANEVAAAKALNDAEDAVEQGDAETDAAAQAAEQNKDNANNEAGASKGFADSAEAVEKVASKAMQEAIDAKTRDEAFQAAAAAGAASTLAQSAASDAIASAKNAADEAENAKSEYEKALAAYEAAKIEAQEKLDQGLLNAQEAAELTQAAADRADEAYEAMAAAQEAANQAAIDAQDRVDKADQALVDQINALDDAITTTAATVKQNTETAVLTGAALAAAKLVAKASDIEVEYYNGQIEAKQKDIDELNAKIDDAKAKIEAAQDEVDAARYALDAADSNYKEKAAELEEAEKALDIARKVVADAENIRAEREKEGAEEALNAVIAGEASTEQKQTVAKLLLENGIYNSSGESLSVEEWDGDDIVIVTKGEETKYYKVESAEDGDDVSYHFTEVEPKTEKDAPGADKSVWDNSGSGRNTRDTAYKGRDLEDGSVGSIQIVKSTYLFVFTTYSYKITIDGVSYDLTSNGDGTYSYTDAEEKTHSVMLFEEVPKYYASVEDGEEITGSSSKVVEIWDAAETDAKAAAYRQVKQDAARASRVEVAIAEGALRRAQNNKWIRLQNEIAADEQTVKDLEEEKKELSMKLNGNLAEQLVVVVAKGGGEDEINAVLGENIGVVLGPEDQARYDELMAQYEDANIIQKAIIWVQVMALVNRVMSAEGIELSDIMEQGSYISAVIQAATDDEMNLDDVKAVGNLLLNGGFSARTRGYIIDKIVEFLTTAHHNAVEELKTSVTDGAKNISVATSNVAKASAEVVASHADLAVKDALAKAAKALADDALDKKEAADLAAEDAAKALADYQALMETYGPDDTNVENARIAAEDAQAYADQAAADAERAKEAAAKAQADYEAALAAAGGKKDPEPKPAPSPDPVNPVNPNNGNTNVINGKSSNKSSKSSSGKSGKSSKSTGSSSYVTTGTVYTDAADNVLGEDIASYAASLKGKKYATLVNNDNDKLNTKAFVDYVYRHFDIALDLDGKKVEDIAKNGTLVDNDMRESGDLLIITDDDGAILGYAVNYDMDTFIRYSKKAGKVEVFDTKDLKGNYKVVRVV